MALSGSIMWEVRTTGSDNNGGGFKTGAAGTDYSQQNSAQKSGTDLAIHASDNTKVQPVAAGVAAADVGNVIQITAGTNFTVGFYEITAQDGTYWTLDRAVGTTGSTGGTYAMGGALATFETGVSLLTVNGMFLWVKNTATYSPVGNEIAMPSGTFQTVGVAGYGTTRGDGVRAIFDCSGMTAGQNFFAASSSSQIFYNLQASGAKKDTFVGGNWINCRAISAVEDGFSGGSQIYCSAENCGGCGYDNASGGSSAFYSQAIGNTSHGFFGWGGTCVGCLAADNGGVGFHSRFQGGNFYGCTSAFNTSHGISGAEHCHNTVVYGNGGYGLVQDHGYGNTTRLMRFAAGGSTSGSINPASSARYEIGSQITLTADPFTDSANGDYSLNNASGGGALLRGGAIPGMFGDGTTTGYPDIGAVQVQKPTDAEIATAFWSFDNRTLTS
jgi:hypothetical protein